MVYLTIRLYICFGLKNEKMKKILLFIAIAISSYGYSQNNVTFKVDMNDYTGDFTEIQLNGTFNEWCGDCNPMSDDDADGVWEVTLPLEDESIEFKYTFDNWTGQESLSPGSVCTVTNSGFTNRYLEISGDTILPVMCWESCFECTGIPSNVDVTFKVDLSDYTEAYSMVNLNGTFNSWCGECAVMTDDDADDIYELTISVPTADTVEYKFTLDGWTVDEQLTEGSPCTITTIDDGVFTNRFLVLSADTVLPAVCWEYCVECDAVGINENSWTKDLSISPNPSNGILNISGELAQNEALQITVSDVNGKVVYSYNESTNLIRKTIDLSTLENGMYLLNVSSDLINRSEKIFILK